MHPPTQPFSLLIKPASADCNLACEYCFYLGKRALYPGTACHRMPDAVLERMIATYLATEQPGRQYVFGWQGGEPTLMGLDFFRRAAALQIRHAPRGAVISNGLQTNATLIDDPFAAFLAEYKYLVGVSLDGPADVHDRFRHNHAGAGSHAAVRKGIEALRRHQVEFNILVLVSQANVKEARRVYRTLRDEGFYFHQYIPCVEFDATGQLQPFAISAEDWGVFLCDLFDEWRALGDERRVSIRHFDTLLDLMVNGRRNTCCIGLNCCQYLVVEHNGDLYPCDFFVRPELRLGNLMKTSWTEALASPKYRKFGARKAQWNPACRDCPWLTVCAGDCLKHRLRGPALDSHTLSSLCAGWQAFFRHALPAFETLARDLKAQARIQQLQHQGFEGR